jgi:hypothetical protein
MAKDTRMSDLKGEDLTKGPTPQTRHPEGKPDDITDTTEGPTPETREADRRAEAEAGQRPHAAGQPESDEATRADSHSDQR